MYRPTLVRRSPLLVELRDIQIEGSYHVPCPTYSNNILRYDTCHTHYVSCTLYSPTVCLSLSSLSLQAQCLPLRSLILRSIMRMATTCLIRNTKPPDLKTYRKTHHFMCTIGGREGGRERGRGRGHIYVTLLFLCIGELLFSREEMVKFI